MDEQTDDDAYREEYFEKHKNSRNFKILMKVILANSKSKDIFEAIREWDAQPVENYNEPTHCECTHEIMERCVITNSKTQKTLTVGNCCIKLFWPESIKTILAIREGRLNRSLIDKALKDGVITQENHKFLLDVFRKTEKRLSPKQIKYRSDLRRRIFKKYNKNKAIEEEAKKDLAKVPDTSETHAAYLLD